MGKKCIPGVFCIENMTLAFLFIMVCMMVYLYYSIARNIYKTANKKDNTKIIVLSNPSFGTTVSNVDTLNDPYVPPLKQTGYYQSTDSSDIRGQVALPDVPINMKTRGRNVDYNQIGILTRSSSADNNILPLMGRRHMHGRDKWQYYTMSNTGNINTKLPVSVNGKNCTSEYGCDEINNNDTIYVEGYRDVFNATIYENGAFSYIPYI